MKPTLCTERPFQWMEDGSPSKPVHCSLQVIREASLNSRSSQNRQRYDGRQVRTRTATEVDTSSTPVASPNTCRPTTSPSVGRKKGHLCIAERSSPRQP